MTNNLLPNQLEIFPPDFSVAERLWEELDIHPSYLRGKILIRVTFESAEECDAFLGLFLEQFEE